MATTLEPTNHTSATKPIDASHESDAAATDLSPKRTAKKKTVAGRLAKSLLMTMRRVHLYSGIFMFPFVLLYGFSGWFFNHPGYFREGESVSFSAADVADGQLSVLPSATEVAEAVVEEMNIESFMVDGPEIVLTQEQSPRFSGFLKYTVDAGDATHNVTVNPNTGSGEIKTVMVDQDEPVTEEPVNPLADVRLATIAGNPLESVRLAVPAVLDDLELTSAEASPGRRAPSVVFSVVANDIPCLVTYNLGNGNITSVRQDARPTMEFKDQLRRMHLARMYTPQLDTRWVWALVVDAMFVSMVFWGVSGLFMWWQVKRTRLLGAGVLLASVVFSFVIFIKMHSNLTEGTGRGGGGGGNAAATQTRSPT